jgi:lipopolysaccharide biosynthesis protein
MMVPNLPTQEINRRLSFWRGLFARPNWLGESWKQEYMRRLLAVESSVRNAHDRINDLDTRKANRDSSSPSA